MTAPRRVARAVARRLTGRAPAPRALRSERNPWAPVEPLLPRRGGRQVVVLGDGTRRADLLPWTARFAADRVRILAAEAQPEWAVDGSEVSFAEADSLNGLSWQLRLLGPIDVLLDLRRIPAEEHWATWRRLFLYLRPGGLYAIDVAGSADGAFEAATADRLGTLLTATTKDPDRSVGKLDRELAGSTGTVQLSRDLIALTKRRRHLVKLRESEANRVLVSRDPGFDLEVLSTLKAGRFESRARVFSHASDVEIPWLPRHIEHPALHLRHYRSPVSFAGSTLTFTDDVILPDSFRHHLMHNPTNPRLINVAPSFARIPERLLPTEDLAGDYYQLDSTYSGHFGHFMTEVISRLWGWDLAKETLPDLKAIVRIKHVNERRTVLENRLFTAYGIPAEDIVTLDHGVRLTSLVSAAPMWHNQDPHYVHPRMAETFDRLRRGLIGDEVPNGGPQAVFISRTAETKRRACRNVAAVEDFFRARGFTVVYPEELDLADQARLFAGVEVVAGFGGSALFNVLYAQRLRAMIVLSHEAYTARNEHLFSSVIGADVHYFWSPPDIAHPEGGWRQAAFDSDWAFDFDRNAADLDGVLAAL